MGRFVIPILCVCLVVSMSAYWYAFAANRRVVAQHNAIAESVRFPPVLNGFRVSISGVEQSDSFEAADSGRQYPVHAKTLVLVSSDTCDACRRGLPRWRELLKTRLPGQVLLFSYEGDEIVRELGALLRSTGQPFKIFRITQRELFQFGTGMVSAPSTIVLDESMRVRFVTATMTDTDALQIHALLAHDLTGETP